MSIRKILHYLPFVHFYSKWETVAELDKFARGDRKIGFALKQKRECELCGKIKLRLEEVEIT